MKKRGKRKKKTKGSSWKWLLMVCCLLALISIALVNHFLFRNATHYGIKMPTGYHTHGIDISQYQGTIDWDALCSPQDNDVPISFVYMRATMDMRNDKKFKVNWQEAKAHGLKRGAYLFFHPNKDGVRQAELFIKRVGNLDGCLPPVVDIEKNYRTDAKLLKKRLQDCLNTLHNYYGIRPVVYTYTTFYRDFLGTAFDQYPLWIAHYEREDKPDYISREWDIWQHSERGRIAGTNEFVDFNVLNCHNSIMPCEVCTN
ncbi:glycoside hydrolase family 25 protein [Olivibacter sp. XZL3]|uniref:glycoside hydrolase family 25 protein n=1 Tax=Olivibacter sp. XZL3 TaxID=1735116 RepID=UPI0010657C8F|nr:GH25 family lysozyme [Olivibacter sp. XZL3]